MVAVMSLWMPILISAVLVFLVSSVLHMALRYHRTDFAGVPEEAKVLDALRPFAIPPGDYVLPHAADPGEMKSPEYVEKVKNGPVAFLTVMPNGQPSMGGSLAMWFVYSILVSVIAAYVASRAVDPGDSYLAVFRFTGVTAFTGYSLALFQNSIWYKRKWSATFKSVFDGLVYSLVTAGTFGWLWPS